MGTDRKQLRKVVGLRSVAEAELALGHTVALVEGTRRTHLAVIGHRRKVLPRKRDNLGEHAHLVWRVVGMDNAYHKLRRWGALVFFLHYRHTGKAILALTCTVTRKAFVHQRLENGVCLGESFLHQHQFSCKHVLTSLEIIKRLDSYKPRF